MRRGDATADKARGLSAWTWILGLITVLLIYVLSLGPVVYLANVTEATGPVAQWMYTCYGPLSWVAENTPLGEPLGHYEEWWAWQAWKAKKARSEALTP